MAKNKAKSLLQSKTFWLAALQSIVAVAIIFGDVYPNTAGAALLLKSLLDVMIRFLTEKPVTL